MNARDETYSSVYSSTNNHDTTTQHEAAQCGETQLVSSRAFEQALQAMTPEDQAILVPYYVYGYTATAIGKVYSVNKATMWGRIRRATERTRRRLEGE